MFGPQLWQDVQRREKRTVTLFVWLNRRAFDDGRGRFCSRGDRVYGFEGEGGEHRFQTPQSLRIHRERRAERQWALLGFGLPW